MARRGSGALADALAAFRSGDYETARHLAEAHLEAHPDDEEAEALLDDIAILEARAEGPPEAAFPPPAGAGPEMFSPSADPRGADPAAHEARRIQEETELGGLRVDDRDRRGPARKASRALPFGVILVGVYFILTAVIGVIMGLAVLIASLGVVVLALALAAGQGAVGVGLAGGRSWAWGFGLFLSAIHVALGIALLATEPDLVGFLAVVFAVLVLAYLASVRGVFTPLPARVEEAGPGA